MLDKIGGEVDSLWACVSRGVQLPQVIMFGCSQKPDPQCVFHKFKFKAKAPKCTSYQQVLCSENKPVPPRERGLCCPPPRLLDREELAAPLVQGLEDVAQGAPTSPISREPSGPIPKPLTPGGSCGLVFLFPLFGLCLGTPKRKHHFGGPLEEAEPLMSSPPNVV